MTLNETATSASPTIPPKNAIFIGYVPTQESIFVKYFSVVLYSIEGKMHSLQKQMM